eukprot:GEZU01023709.1.p1 GENE.GEZU01023709.1~~GEZU01023709.1.p1  ORF type:complete len:256 (-),score=52.22 GEZU01023709.1:592-1359(-)
MSYSVLGLGQPLVDIMIRVSDDFLQRMGLEKGGSVEVPLEKLQEIVRCAEAEFLHPQQQQQQQQGCLKSTGAEYRYAQYDNSKKKKNNHNDEDHETYDSDSSSDYGSDRSVCPFPTPTVSGSGNTTPDDEHSDAGAGEGAMLSENESTMISALANVLRTVTETNDLATRYSAKTATLFDCKIMPTFSLESYLWRIATHADCSLEAYILALYYMDTIVAKDGVIKITTRNAYKMLLARCAPTAEKFICLSHVSRNS